MPPPNIPTVDPNSALGQRLLARQTAAPIPGLAFGGRDMGGRSSSDADVEAMIREQHLAALGAPPGGLLPGAVSPGASPAPSTPPGSGRDGEGRPPATPATLAAGQTLLAPVPTRDPFRLNDPGLGPVAGAAGVMPGQVIPFDHNDPRARNPFLYQDNGVWRSSLQRGEMGPGGFTPGFVNNGPGGTRVWADTPADFLIALQRNAAAQGVAPGQLAEQFLTGLNAGADRSFRAGAAAQQGGVNLATGLMQAEAQRDAARTSAEGAARSAAFGAIPGLATAAGSGTMPAALVQSLGDIINSGLMTTPGGPRPGAPGAAPAAPAGGAGVPAVGGGIGAPGAAGATPGAALAAQAAGADFLRPLQPLFGARNAAGVVQAPEGFNMASAVGQLLDRFHTATPDQRAAAVAAIERGDLGNPDQVLQAIGRQAGIATLRARGGLGPNQTGPGNALTMFGLGPNVPFFNSEAPKPHVVMGANGQPVLTLRANPQQNAVAASVSALTSAGVPYNQVVIPGFNPIDFARGDVNSIFGNRAGATPEADQRQGVSAMDLIRMTSRYRGAAGGR